MYNLSRIIICSTVYDLGELRCCDGSPSVQEIRKAISLEGDWKFLLACLSVPSLSFWGIDGLIGSVLSAAIIINGLIFRKFHLFSRNQ